MRMLLIAGVTLSLVSAAHAQEATKDFDFKLSAADVNVIADALGELPYKKSAPLFNKLQSQINAQTQPAKPVVVPEEKKAE